MACVETREKGFKYTDAAANRLDRAGLCVHLRPGSHHTCATLATRSSRRSEPWSRQPRAHPAGGDSCSLATADCCQVAKWV